MGKYPNSNEKIHVDSVHVCRRVGGVYLRIRGGLGGGVSHGSSSEFWLGFSGLPSSCSGWDCVSLWQQVKFKKSSSSDHNKFSEASYKLGQIKKTWLESSGALVRLCVMLCCVVLPSRLWTQSLLDSLTASVVSQRAEGSLDEPAHIAPNRQSKHYSRRLGVCDMCLVLQSVTVSFTLVCTAECRCVLISWISWKTLKSSGILYKIKTTRHVTLKQTDVVCVCDIVIVFYPSFQ